MYCTMSINLQYMNIWRSCIDRLWKTIDNRKSIYWQWNLLRLKMECVRSFHIHSMIKSRHNMKMKTRYVHSIIIHWKLMDTIWSLRLDLAQYEHRVAVVLSYKEVDKSIETCNNLDKFGKLGVEGPTGLFW